MVTTVIKTVKPGGGGDYSTLAAWEVGQRGNLVTRDTIEVAEVYGGGNAAELQMLSANWTVDSTHYAIIRAASGQAHAGIFNSSTKAYAKSLTSGVSTFDIRVGYTRIGPGLSMEEATAGSPASIVRVTDITTDTPCIVDGLIMKCGSGTSSGIFTLQSNTDTTGHVLKNCVIYTDQGATVVRVLAGCKLTVYNCTLKGTGSDTLYANGGTIISQNNYVAGNRRYPSDSGGSITQGTHDATDDASATTAAYRNIAYSTSTFVNVTFGTADHHLAVASPLLEQGIKLSNATPSTFSVTTDFEADNRVGLLFDIGADQSSSVPECWNYTAKYKGGKKIYKVSGPGRFPKSLKVPGNVDVSTGRMVDDGNLIDPTDYTILGV